MQPERAPLLNTILLIVFGIVAVPLGLAMPIMLLTGLIFGGVQGIGLIFLFLGVPFAAFATSLVLRIKKQYALSSLISAVAIMVIVAGVAYQKYQHLQHVSTIETQMNAARAVVPVSTPVLDPETPCRDIAMQTVAELNSLDQRAHNGNFYEQNPQYHMNSKDSTCYYVLVERSSASNQIVHRELNASRTDKGNLPVIECAQIPTFSGCYDDKYDSATFTATNNVSAVPDAGVFEQKAQQYFEGQYKL